MGVCNSRMIVLSIYFIDSKLFFFFIFALLQSGWLPVHSSAASLITLQPHSNHPGFSFSGIFAFLIIFPALLFGDWGQGVWRSLLWSCLTLSLWCVLIFYLLCFVIFVFLLHVLQSFALLPPPLVAGYTLHRCLLFSCN